MTNSHSSSPLQDFSTEVANIVATFAPSIVAVTSHKFQSSGFVWRKGLVVTADEALAEEGDISITFHGGAAAVATVVGRDPSTDVALLRVETGDLQPLPLSAGTVAAGQIAIAVGSSGGLPTAALGTISRAGGPWQSMRGGDIDARIDLNVALGRSAEGSIVLDAVGKALGMAVFAPRRSILAIPAATIERVAGILEAQGRIARGYLGAGLHPVEVAEGGTGIMVMSVDAQGPAAGAGVHQGDILVSWDGKPIDHVKSLLRALGPQSVGKEAKIGLRRAGELREVAIKIGERPAA